MILINMVKLVSYPTLRTVLMIEEFLSSHRADLFSKAAIMRGLNGKINNNNLTVVLDYLESSNKVIQGSRGIQWIASEGSKAKKLMKDALIV